MPTATNDGVSLYFETDGSGPTVVFLNEAGFGAWSWGWQYAALAGPYRAVVFDPRGTGRSDAPDGPYDVAVFVDDCEAVLRAVDARNAHLVGCGLGGMVALRYARRHGRARSVTLVGSARSGDRVDRDAFERMGDTGRDTGRDGLQACFTDAFRADQPDVVEGIAAWRSDEDAAPGARAAHAAAMLGFQCDAPYEVTVPALVLHGRDDPVIPVGAGRDLADALPRGEFVELGGRHLAHVEESRAANDAVAGFLDRVTARDGVDGTGG